MKKAGMTSLIAGVYLVLFLFLCSCIQRQSESVFTSQTKEIGQSVGEFIITPRDNSVVFSRGNILICPEEENRAYTISGYFSGQITVKTKNTTLRLNGVYLENKQGKAAIKSTSNLFLTINPGTSNVIMSRGRNFAKSAALQAKKTLTFQGEGTVYVVGSVCHGAEADKITMRGSHTCYIQGTNKGSALSCEDFYVEKDQTFSCWLFNGKNGIKADDSLEINSGIFYLYDNDCALKTGGSQKNKKAKSLTLEGGEFHTHGNKELIQSPSGLSDTSGGVFIEE